MRGSQPLAAAAFLLLTSAFLLAHEPEKAIPTAEKARLLPGTYVAVEPSVVADAKGRVVVVAIGGGKTGRGDTRLLLWRSEDGGRTWQPPSPLHESKELGSAQADPWLQSFAPGKFAIAYMGASSERPDLPAAVWQRSDDGGKTWSGPRTFHRWVDKTVLAVSPSGTNLAIAFTAFDADKGQGVQVHASKDRGATWQQLPATFGVKKDTYTAQGIAVTDQGAIAIGWSVQSGQGPNRHFRQVLTTRAADDQDWKATELTAVPFDRLEEQHFAGPALTLDGSRRAHAVSIRLEAEKGKSDVVIRSTGDFETWSDPVVLAGGQGAEHRGFPAVAASGSRIHVAWMERKDRKYHVWYRGSADGGKTWSESLLLSRPEHPTDLLTADGFTAPGGHYMSLAEDGAGTVHVIWGVGLPSGFSGKNARGEIWHNVIRWPADGRMPPAP
jgi:hypothetical protein